MKCVVVIVGAGPSGLATAVCLSLFGIPFIILEREDCLASLWKLRSYDRLKLHLAKQFCALPHMPLPPSAPTFVPRSDFIRYLDDYASHFNLNPVYNKHVELATFDDMAGVWTILARDTVTGEVDEYTSRFLVVATGENCEGFIPKIPGLERFSGAATHSSEYKSGSRYAGKRVVVVGSGNSGLEIAYDLSQFGAKTCISIRSPFHVVTKEMIYLGMVLLKYLPMYMVDALVLMLCKFKYGDLSKYGIVRPTGAPFFLKATTGRSPVIEAPGTVDKIKSGEIQVLPAIASVNGDEVMFSDGKSYPFDAIVFATGYKSTANNWLKDEDHLLNKDGMPKQSFPNHWKGKNGVYCAGLSRRGLAGLSMDAQLIAKDINMELLF